MSDCGPKAEVIRWPEQAAAKKGQWKQRLKAWIDRL